MTDEPTTEAPLVLPDLSGVITPADVSTKGTGKYIAEYVNWMRVAHLLQVHAPGWQFHLQMSPEGAHVWRAPDQTGYLVGFFSSPCGRKTPDFPQAVMNNRNDPVPFAEISARDVTDTHRRCLAAAAAFTFGLAWQLWAREPIEDPYHRPERQAPEHARGNGNGNGPRMLSTPEELAEKGLKNLVLAGLTPLGQEAMVRELGHGKAQTMVELPANILARLCNHGVSPETLAAWNRGEVKEPPETQASTKAPTKAPPKAPVKKPPAPPHSAEPGQADDPPLAWDLPPALTPTTA